MSVFIKSFFHKNFPARQLLIRQNGEVKHVVLAPWLQVSVLAIIITAIVWMSVSSIRVYMQTHQISHIEQTQLDKQAQWQQKVKQQQQRYALQQEQLAELEQKQALLQGMIESLPASISKDAIKLEGELDSSPINESESEFHEPLEDDKSQNKQADNNATSFEQRYTLLNQQYDTNFTLLAAQINQRHDAILEILQDTGLENALAQHLALAAQTTAQGGPLDILDESKIPNTFLAIADKLLVLNQLENFLTALPNTLPLPAAKYYISSNFGLRKDPMNKRRAFHKGVDLAGWHKTEIFAPADATVRRAGRNGGYGNFIELEHKNGVVTRFGHLNKVNVKKGQVVAKHDVIGLMGSTGRSTSTHLHYEVLIDDKHVNPLKITKALSRVW
ncbi:MULTISPECIES: M23 family metallopeptidase [Pseudoalteromonas]|uniref:M23 family metallopeptidase n=1 Tax=Pseudoalteromonas TaxID=53246 RepID=UPI002356C9CE|nr:MULTISPECIES: M23 family metallopeptidase [Pseudoalteromonas]MDN3404400.1 M23 family metallopeptidase [Pseudoalteromonas sp. APC 3218]MDN3408303.1 M23 family metallopeptidase [Pseudoalteromonas sp. APC 3894]MDN3415943.1 M23 family metallopeptidase [Pseudoalteromonas sp. APC 3227]MDN3419641.1 M23 family metallopeptidase [Pseudoalteromonas sp. APC 3895]MDN3423010.1 M23 family metallopeptidase [Pseudoalteromonas sp. APC 3896]|tara:strand:+ start:15168 stop:16331 length:1164 start_codon:yes stop_codon:yes gene_type:complete